MKPLLLFQLIILFQLLISGFCQINIAPIASFSFAVVSGTYTVSFDGRNSYDTDGTIVGYSWDFGEPASGVRNRASSNVASHTYATAGIYTVALTVTDNGGGTKRFTRDVSIGNSPPTADFTYSQQSSSYTVSFDGTKSSDPNGRIATYAWDFGDASSGASNTATGSTGSHTYAALGTYTVTLTVTDPQGLAASTKKSVVVTTPNSRPIANFKYTQSNLAINVDATASTDPDGSIVSYSWDFGEPASATRNTATGATASHNYGAAGVFTVTLTVTDNSGSTQTKTQTVDLIAAPPTATFRYAQSGSNRVVSFDATGSSAAIGNIRSYTWNFGDPSSGTSNTATGVNPSHAFTTPGTYTVKLTVTDTQGTTDIETLNVVVTNQIIAPTASFEFVRLPGSRNYTFDATSSVDPDGTIASYSWDFGDPSSNTRNTATGSTPFHTYATPGTYPVALVVTDNQGVTGTMSQNLVVRNALPDASFVYTQAQTSLIVGFDALASTDPDGRIAGYSWNFGDPSTGASDTTTGSTPSHTYSRPGAYIVTLIVTDDLGATANQTQDIFVADRNLPPTASFQYTQAQSSRIVSFDATASSDVGGSIARYAWNFGDSSSGPSNTDVGPTPSHNYAKTGTYTVTLTVTDNQGATRSQIREIVVTNVPPIANLLYTQQQDSLVVNFDATSSSDLDGNIAMYAWNFGDSSGTSSNTATGRTPSHTYAIPGTYFATLTLTDNEGVTGTQTRTVVVTSQNIPPTASFEYTQAPDSRSVAFDANSSFDPDGDIASYSWNFGDALSGASNTATGPTPLHAYTGTGTYTVRLTVTDNQGTTGSQTRTVVVTNIPPTASFDYLQADDDLVVSFNALASTDPVGGIDSFFWDFGDSTTSSTSTPTPSHTYPAPGIYTVTLIVTDNQGATGTETRDIAVSNRNSPPIASFIYIQAQDSRIVRFDASSSFDPDGSITSYLWNFDDPSSDTSNTATTPVPTHNYVNTGVYTVTLTVTDNQGASRTQTRDIVVTNIPPVAISQYTQAEADFIIAFDGTASYDPDGSIAKYIWDFGDSSDGAVKTANGSTVSHTYPGPGLYLVTLTVKDNDGDAGSETKFIVVADTNTAPIASFVYTQLQNSRNVSFDARDSSDLDGRIVRYDWDFGDPSSGSDNIGTGPIAYHSYGPAGTYAVTLAVTDNQGATRTLSRSIVVTNIPAIASFGYAQEQTSLVVDFDATASTDPDGSIESYSWNFGDPSSGTASNTATGLRPAHTFSAPGTYDVTLTLTDNFGSTSTQTRSVVVTNRNIPPIVTFEFTQLGSTRNVNFDATDTFDLDGRIVSYAWNFGDPSSGASNTATGPTPVHTYLATGAYNVTLTVTDNQGGTRIRTREIVVTNVPPVANFMYEQVITGLSVNFNGAMSFDPDGSVTRYVWDYGNAGNTTAGSGVSSSHTYPVPGTYVVTLTVIDNEGARGMLSLSIVVRTPNIAPVAKFTTKQVGNTYIVNFDGTGSSDRDGRVISYDWNFGEPSSGPDDTASGLSSSHNYAKAGTYFVTLMVTDNQGSIGVVTQPIVVSEPNIAPIAAIDYTIIYNTHDVYFEATRSLDADGTIVSYLWNFGDPASGASNTATIQNPSHTYQTAGEFTVTLTVTDNRGATGTTSETVFVNIAPTAVYKTTQIPRTNTVTFDARISSDPDGSIMSYAWNFGDPSSGTTNNVATGPTTVHTFSEPGLFLVTLATTDNLGATTRNSSYITLTNAIPFAMFQAFQVNFETHQVYFDASSSYDMDGPIASYTWNFGDPASGASNTARGPTQYHTFTIPGDYTVTLTVTDSTGQTGTDSDIITVI